MNNFIKNQIITAVVEAGNKILKCFGQNSKDKKSKITDYDYGILADKLSEKIIVNAIRNSDFKCKIVSEESKIIENENSEYSVYLDPLDGSVNFSRGIPVFCVGLGILRNNKPILGIIYDPNNKELFITEKSKGVFLNGKKIIRKANKQNLLINLEWFGADNYAKMVARLKEAKQRARTAGSGILALCYGIIGRGDAAILLQNSPWDIAPGLAFAKELGIKIKQLDGENIDLSKRKNDILAAPEEIFNKIYKIVR